MESSKDVKHSDFLESKGSSANRAASDRRTSLPSCDEAGLRVPEPPGPHSDTAAEMGQKSSSSSSSSSSSAQSNRSCEFSLPGFQKEKYPEEFSLLKSQTKDGQRPEWTFYPRFSSNIHTYHVGKQCFFSGVFRGNRRSVVERTVDKSLGRKKYEIDPRNGIPKLTPGDNPYMFPEQSKEFFKAGSTLPPVNFSLVPYEKKFDTFIPLEPLPQIPKLLTKLVVSGHSDDCEVKQLLSVIAAQAGVQKEKKYYNPPEEQDHWLKTYPDEVKKKHT